jgi:hypothetical protein
MPETINVEHAGTSYTVLYLYKYLFKGNKKVKATFEKVDYSNKKDENFMYMRGKYICSMKLMSKSMESMSNEQETYPATKLSGSRLLSNFLFMCIDCKANII